MHVILEGVLNLEAQLLLSLLVRENYFTLDFLNERIANFPYGRSEKRNKPPRAFTSANLSGSKLPLSGMWLAMDMMQACRFAQILLPYM